MTKVDSTSTGLIGKRITHHLITYMECIFESRSLLREEHRLDSATTKVEKAALDHDLDLIGKEHKLILNHLDKGDVAGYRLGVNSFLMLKYAIVCLRQFRGVLRKDFAHIKDIMKQLEKDGGRDFKTLNLPEKERKLLIELNHEILKDEKCSSDDLYNIAKEIQDELHDDQTTIFQIEKDTGGNISWKFVGKQDQNSITEFLQRIRLRHLVKDLSHKVHDAKAEEEKARKILDDIWHKELLKGIFNNIHNHTHVTAENIHKHEETAIRKFHDYIAALNQMYTNLKEVVKDSYKILLLDMMVIHHLIKNAGQISADDHKWMVAHEIPQKMGFENIEELKKWAADNRENVHNLQKSVNQLFALVHDNWKV